MRTGNTAQEAQQFSDRLKVTAIQRRFEQLDRFLGNRRVYKLTAVVKST